MYLTDWWTNRQTGEQTDRQWWMDLLTWLTIKVTDSLPLELTGTLSHDWLSNWLMTDCQSEWLSNRLSRWLRAWFIDVWLTVLLLPLQQFSTIIELVDYYSQHPVDLKSGGSTCLTAACPVRLWSTDSRRSSVVDSICLARTTWNCFCLDVFPTEKRCPRNVRFQLILMLLV